MEKKKKQIDKKTKIIIITVSIVLAIACILLVLIPFAENLIYKKKCEMLDEKYANFEYYFFEKTGPIEAYDVIFEPEECVVHNIGIDSMKNFKAIIKQGPNICMYTSYEGEEVSKDAAAIEGYELECDRYSDIDFSKDLDYIEYTFTVDGGDGEFDITYKDTPNNIIKKEITWTDYHVDNGYPRVIGKMYYSKFGSDPHYSVEDVWD